MCADDITKHITRSYAGVYAPRKVDAQTIRQSVIANLVKSGNNISAVQIFAGINILVRYKNTSKVK